MYQLDITDPAQILAIGAQSTSFDTFLILMDGKGNVLASDDNSGGGSNALIVQPVDPGSYYVVVKPADDGTSAGNYVITTAASSAADIHANTQSVVTTLKKLKNSVD